MKTTISMLFAAALTLSSVPAHAVEPTGVGAATRVARPGDELFGTAGDGEVHGGLLGTASGSSIDHGDVPALWADWPISGPRPGSPTGKARIAPPCRSTPTLWGPIGELWRRRLLA